MYPIAIAFLFSIIPHFVPVSGAPAVDRQTSMQNGEKAQKLNAQFASLKKTDPCQGSEVACVEGLFAQCVGGAWQTTPCGGGAQCVVLPLVNSAGTSVTCDTKADALSRISATGVSGGLTGSGSGTVAASSNGTESGDGSDCSADAGTPSNSTASSGVAHANHHHAAHHVASSNNADATATVTVTVTATRPGSVVATRSATLAPGFSLPAAPSNTPSPTGSLNSLNGSDTSIFSSSATTITLTPASASAFLSAASDQSTASSVPSVSGADPSAATGAAGAISLSLFSTTLSGPTPDASQGSVAAATATPSADGSQGSVAATAATPSASTAGAGSGY